MFWGNLPAHSTVATNCNQSRPRCRRPRTRMIFGMARPITSSSRSSFSCSLRLSHPSRGDLWISAQARVDLLLRGHRAAIVLIAIAGIDLYLLQFLPTPPSGPERSGTIGSFPFPVLDRPLPFRLCSRALASICSPISSSTTCTAPSPVTTELHGSVSNRSNDIVFVPARPKVAPARDGRHHRRRLRPPVGHPISRACIAPGAPPSLRIPATSDGDRDRVKPGQQHALKKQHLCDQFETPSTVCLPLETETRRGYRRRPSARPARRRRHQPESGYAPGAGLAKAAIARSVRPIRSPCGRAG